MAQLYRLSGYVGRIVSAGHDGDDYWTREWLNEDFEAVHKKDAIDKSNTLISGFLDRHPNLRPGSDKAVTHFSQSEYINHCKFALGRIVWKKEFVPASPYRPEIKPKPAIPSRPAHYEEVEL